MKTQSYTCAHCGIGWTRQAARGQVPKWCPDCRGRYWIRQCPGCNERKPILTGNQHCSDCVARNTRACRRCGRAQPMDPGRYTCSECRQGSAIEVRSVAPSPHTGSVHVRTARRLTSGRCRKCQTWFVSLHLDVTCSDECKTAHNRDVRKIGKDRRRARKRDAYRADVYRLKVFEADGYRCHLCRRKTDPTAVVPHPRAPTIDHVIPLARDGTHEPSNCRTACYRCNSAKGDRGGGEQLLLLAI